MPLVFFVQACYNCYTVSDDIYIYYADCSLDCDHFGRTCVSNFPNFCSWGSYCISSKVKVVQMAGKSKVLSCKLCFWNVSYMYNAIGNFGVKCAFCNHLVQCPNLTAISSICTSIKIAMLNLCSATVQCSSPIHQSEWELDLSWPNPCRSINHILSQR